MRVGVRSVRIVLRAHIIPSWSIRRETRLFDCEKVSFETPIVERCSDYYCTILTISIGHEGHIPGA